MSWARWAHARQGRKVQDVAFLLIQRPGHTDERAPLPDTQLRVGRLPDNELVIDEPSVSRHHALISPSRYGHTVADLESRNGIWVNGQRAIDAPVPLRHGDEVELGGQGVVVKYFADEARTSDATAFFMRVPELERHRIANVLPNVLYEGERFMKVLRVTPWLRLVGAAIGTAAAVLALLYWIIRWLAG